MDHRPTRPRDYALDALRGVAISGMVLANLQASDTDAFAWIAHAAWDGLTVADLQNRFLDLIAS